MYFEKITDRKARVLSKIPEKFKGKYVFEKDSLNRIYVDDSTFNGVSFIYLQGEKSKLLSKPNVKLRDNYLFGIVNNDSLPCVEENDTLYYGIPLRSELFNVNDLSQPIYVLSDNEFIFLDLGIMNSKCFTCTKYTFYDDRLEISSVDHDLEMELIKRHFKMDTEMIDGFKTYICRGSISNFIKFSNANGFNDIVTYYKVKNE